MFRSVLCLIVPVAVAALGGCEKPASTASSGATSAAWVLASEPEGAHSVADAKASANEGDQVVIRGRIGGRLEPIGSDSPVFTIVDLGLPHCGEMDDDGHCPTPWDYCCETPESLIGNSATVQLISTDGEAIDPVAGGLSALDEVVVVGAVGPRPTPEVLTIRATGVYRK